MLGNLGENLTNTMKKLVGMSVIDKKTIKEVVKDIQRALIQSDVNIKLVLDLSKKIEERALEEEPPKGITPREHVITIIYEEMVNLLGSEAADLDINDRPYKILFLGLQGSGKTTTIGKLCRYLQKKGFNPAVVCTDTWRPAAYEQLKQLTEEMDVPLYGDPNNKDALDLAQKGFPRLIGIDRKTTVVPLCYHESFPKLFAKLCGHYQTPLRIDCVVVFTHEHGAYSYLPLSTTFHHYVTIITPKANKCNPKR